MGTDLSEFLWHNACLLRTRDCDDIALPRILAKGKRKVGRRGAESTGSEWRQARGEPSDARGDRVQVSSLRNIDILYPFSTLDHD